MLTPHLQSRFIEKVLTDRAGQQFRVLFLVSIVNREVRGQIISAQPVGERLKIEDSKIKDKCAVLCLPCQKDNFVPILISDFSIFNSLLSPYSSLEFFMSQPTRAPSK